ncbi:uncharacterized protein METZ01_LOCUS391098, partial [marine metagenome]
MGNKGLVYLVASLLWVGCGSSSIGKLNRPNGGDISKLVRPQPTPSGMYIHPDTKQPFDGEYDVVENGIRLRIEIRDGWPHGRWQRWYPSGRLHE